MDPRVSRRGPPPGRAPPGPPKTRAIELYKGYLPRPGETIAHEPSTISAHDMWSKYISKRRPVVIDGFLTDEAWKGDKWTDVEYVRSKAGFAEVKIEPVHPTAGHFGTAQKRQKVRFGAFLDMLQDPDQAGKWYLTTQYEDEQDQAAERASSLNPTAARLRPLGQAPPSDDGEAENGQATARGSGSKRKREQSSSDSEGASRVAEELSSLASGASDSSPPTSLDDDDELELDPVLPSPTHALAEDFPLQAPGIMGNLVLQQCNLWLGNSPKARSSGLHHDMHDNLYVLLAGRKRFLLFPPIAHKWLRPRGDVEWIHPNGLIVYGEEGVIPAWHPAGSGLPIVRGDGLLPIDAARWRLRARERSLKEADDKAAELAGEGAVVANRRKGKAKQTVEQALALERFQEAELALRLLVAQRDEEDDDGRSSAGSLTMEDMLALVGSRASRMLDHVVSSDDEHGLSDLEDDDDEEDDEEGAEDDGGNWPLTTEDEVKLLSDPTTNWIEIIGPRQPPAFLLLRWRAGDAVATEILVRWSQQREELIATLAELRRAEAEGDEESEEEDDDDDDSDAPPSANSDLLRMEAEGEQMTEAQIRQAIREGKLAVADVGQSSDGEGSGEGESDEDDVEAQSEPARAQSRHGRRKRGERSDEDDASTRERSRRKARSPPLRIPPGMLPGGLRGRVDGLPDSDDDDYINEADEFAEVMLADFPGADEEEGDEVTLEDLNAEMRQRVEALLAAQGVDLAGDEDDSDEGESDDEDEDEDDDDEDSQEGVVAFGGASDGSDWGEGDVDDGEAALAALAAQAGDDAGPGVSLLGANAQSAADNSSSDEEEEDNEPMSFSVVSPQDVHRYFGIPDQLAGEGKDSAGGASAASKGKGETKRGKKKKSKSPLTEDDDDDDAADDEEKPQIHPGCPRPLIVDLRPGQMLYLPTSWFHEVTSAAVAPQETSDDKTTEGGSGASRDLRDFAHAALNYWFWPPTALEPRPSSADQDRAGEGEGNKGGGRKGERRRGKKDRLASVKGEGRAPPGPSPEEGASSAAARSDASSAAAAAAAGGEVGTHLSPYEDVEVWDEVRRSVEELVRDAKRLAARQRRAAQGAATPAAVATGGEEGNKRRREA